MKLDIWYMVTNGGDGSAYPTFIESKELADLIDEHQVELYDGWSEESVGSITVESDSEIKIVDKIITIDATIEEWELDLEFFKNGQKEILQGLISRAKALVK